MKKISRHELMQYGTAVISFLIVMTFTLLIFFWFVQQSVDKSVQNVIQKNTLQQKDHLELVLEKEYEFLESPAAYFGTTSDLFSSDNLQLLAELASSSSFHRLMLFSTDGIGHSSDGKNTDASSLNLSRHLYFAHRDFQFYQPEVRHDHHKFDRCLHYQYVLLL